MKHQLLKSGIVRGGYLALTAAKTKSGLKLFASGKVKLPLWTSKSFNSTTQVPARLFSKKAWNNEESMSYGGVAIRKRRLNIFELSGKVSGVLVMNWALPAPHIQDFKVKWSEFTFKSF